MELLGVLLLGVELLGVLLLGVELLGVELLGADEDGVELLGVELPGVLLLGFELLGALLLEFELDGADEDGVEFGVVGVLRCGMNSSSEEFERFAAKAGTARATVAAAASAMVMGCFTVCSLVE